MPRKPIFESSIFESSLSRVHCREFTVESSLSGVHLPDIGRRE